MTRPRPIYFSFFMFDSNTRLYDGRARASYIEHVAALAEYGYAGFELHVGRSPEVAVAHPTYAAEVEAYAAFRRELDAAGFGNVQLATNVGVTPALDPSSPASMAAENR